MIELASRALTEQATLNNLWSKYPKSREAPVPSVGLAVGEPAYISSEICGLISAAAQTIPPWGLRPVDLYTLYGFAWLAAPIDSFARPDAADPHRLAAFSWVPCYNAHTTNSLIPLPPSTIAPLDDSDGVAIAAWGYGIKDRVSAMLFQCVWQFGETLEETLQHREADGQAQARDALRWFMAMLAFTRQRILVSARIPGDRASRRRAEEAGLVHQECRVLVLRKVSLDHAEVADGAVEWSCRWWVSGHWRLQACGVGQQDHRPVWIAPHLKGPDDKPVRTTPRLVAMIR